MHQESKKLDIILLKPFLYKKANAYKFKKSLGREIWPKVALFFFFLSLTSIGLANTDLKNHVESNLPQNSHIRQLKWKDQSYWIKKADLNKGWLSCMGKKILSLLAPDKIVKPTTVCEKDILNVEARRLKECEQKQGACVRLIMQGRDWLLTNNGGTGFEQFLNTLPVDRRLPYIIEGLEAVLKLHTHHMVHGRASAKDLTINTSQHFIFIDLAEDPESVMSYDEARLRDLINYFITTLPFLQNTESLKRQYLTIFLERLPPELIPLLKRLIKNTQGFEKMASTFWRIVGRDMAKFANAHRLFQEHLKKEETAQ